MQDFPVKLSRDPILEALFEIRFEASDVLVPEILPGVLFSQLRSDYPRVESLPIAQLPPAAFAADPELRYKATKRLVGSGSAILIGPRVLTLSCLRPYWGWDAFRERICDLLRRVAETGLVQKTERFSLRYLNLIPVPSPMRGLTKVRANVKLGPYDLSRHGCAIRTEIHDAPHYSILHINSDVTAQRPNEEVSGVLIDIDIVNATETEGFLEDPTARLDAAHSSEKAIFFSLLTDETLQELEPVWEER